MVKPTNKLKKERRGVVLLAVLVVIVLLTLAAYQFRDLMLSEYRAAANSHHAVQARALADSGVQYAAALLANADTVNSLLGGNPYHNEQYFSNITVSADGNGKSAGRFFFVAPHSDDPSTFRSGVADESGKINLIALMKRDPTGELAFNFLKKLPMPVDNWEEIAASIVDWMDTNSTPRQGGAESDYYSGLSPGYRAKNGPPDSIEELLLVKGVDAYLLYGDDRNRNGVQDANEQPSGAEYFPGLAAFLTIHSREANTDAQGTALLYLNDDKLDVMYEQLAPAVGDDLAKFIVMYRQYGPANTSGTRLSFSGSIASMIVLGTRTTKASSKSSSSSSEETKQGKLPEYNLDFKKSAKQKLKSLFELVDTQVSITTTREEGNRKITVKTIYTSPLSDPALRRELLPKLFEKGTTVQETEIPARINVNTAPREVLLAIPDLTEAEVESIINLRPSPDSVEPMQDIYRTPAWLLTEANIKASTLKNIEQSITTRTQVYRVQVIGVLDQEGDHPASARVEAVIDANHGRPRILSWRDLGDWGRGMPKMR